MLCQSLVSQRGTFHWKRSRIQVVRRWVIADDCARGSRCCDEGTMHAHHEQLMSVHELTSCHLFQSTIIPMMLISGSTLVLVSLVYFLSVNLVAWLAKRHQVSVLCRNFTDGPCKHDACCVSQLAASKCGNSVCCVQTSSLVPEMRVWFMNTHTHTSMMNVIEYNIIWLILWHSWMNVHPDVNLRCFMNYVVLSTAALCQGHAHAIQEHVPIAQQQWFQSVRAKSQESGIVFSYARSISPWINMSYWARCPTHHG